MSIFLESIKCGSKVIIFKPYTVAWNVKYLWLLAKSFHEVGSCCNFSLKYDLALWLAQCSFYCFSFSYKVKLRQLVRAYTLLIFPNHWRCMHEDNVNSICLYITYLLDLIHLILLMISLLEHFCDFFLLLFELWASRLDTALSWPHLIILL